MILILNKQTNAYEAEQLLKRLNLMGFNARLQQRDDRMVLAVVDGIDSNTQIEHFKYLPFVENIEMFTQPFKLAGNDLHKERTVIQIKNKKIGDGELCIIAGPCSIESEQQINRIATEVSKVGAQVLRGGAFKPRTSPYDFQGLGEVAVNYISHAAAENNMLSMTEVLDVNQLEIAAEKIDIIQIGARNMQNFALLKELGRVKNPILLKRGFSATYKDFLMAAEYILNSGNPNVILCERGIRTFENYTRNTLDIAAVPVLHALSHLPVIVDPSHGTGIRSMVIPMAKAAVAAGADGVMVEVHYDPDRSISDAQQTISTQSFMSMIKDLKRIKEIITPSMESESEKIN